MFTSRSLLKRIGSGLISAILLSSSVTGGGCADSGGAEAPVIDKQARPFAFHAVASDGRKLSGTVALEGDEAVVTIGGQETRASVAGAPETVKVSDNLFEIRQGDEVMRLELVNDTVVAVDLPVGSVRLTFPDGVPMSDLSTDPSQREAQGLILAIFAGWAIGTVACMVVAEFSCGFGNVAVASVYDWNDGLCYIECK